MLGEISRKLEKSWKLIWEKLRIKISAPEADGVDESSALWECVIDTATDPLLAFYWHAKRDERIGGLWNSHPLASLELHNQHSRIWRPQKK